MGTKGERQWRYSICGTVVTSPTVPQHSSQACTRYTRSWSSWNQQNQGQSITALLLAWRVSGCCQSLPYVWGLPESFIIETDHKPLTWLQKNERHKPDVDAVGNRYPAIPIWNTASTWSTTWQCWWLITWAAVGDLRGRNVTKSPEMNRKLI